LTRITHPLSRAAARLVRATTALLLAALLLLTLVQQIGSVGPWWLEISRYLPYPVLLAPAIAALLLSCWLGRRWLIASALTLGLVVTLAMGLAWGRPDTGGMPLRFMTYNVKAYKAVLRSGGFAALADEVALHRPDIVVLQDNVGATRTQAAAMWPGGRAFGLPHAYMFEEYLIASRYPLHDCAPGRIDYRGQAHGYLRCSVGVNGVVLDVVSAHFESPRGGLNAARREGLDGAGDWRQNHEERLGQARALARDLRNSVHRSARPLIVAGDLNAPESSPVIRTLQGIGLRDAFSSAGHGYGYTYGHALRVGFSFLRIDHVLVSAQIGVAACFVGNANASDHRPVIADLLLPVGQHDVLP
jgi:vancomycin resistance protein VanJ